MKQKKNHSKYKYTYYQKHPDITKPTHTHTHISQNPHIYTPTHYKTHTYTQPHITKPTHTHTHTYTHPHITKPTHTHHIQGGADKPLAWPTSRCRRTESIVSLENGVLFMCQIASLFLLQRLKGSMSGDARDFNNIEMRAVIKFFFSCKARRWRKFTPFWQKH